MTNDMNEAMERAGKALDPNAWDENSPLYSAMLPRRILAVNTAQAAIVAFLRAAPVSEGMCVRGAHQKHMIDASPEAVWKAMSTQLADEIEGMSNGQ